MSNMLLVIDMLNDFVHENGVLSFQRDYRITVPVKGVADFDNNNHMAALDRMETLYGAKIIEE